MTVRPVERSRAALDDSVNTQCFTSGACSTALQACGSEAIVIGGLGFGRVGDFVSGDIRILLVPSFGEAVQGVGIDDVDAVD